ncbi:MAG TPA: hypothetical protein VMW95_02870 [Desulfobacterales bacterium]|nr:hypothetical protein [Desulfobacterales bacterium]
MTEGVIDRSDPRIGFWTPDNCPRKGCTGHLMRNAVGNSWCDSISCNYHFHDGKEVVARRERDEFSQERKRDW